MNDVEEDENNTKGEKDDEEFTTDEMMKVANVLIEEEVQIEQDEVLSVVFIDNGKVACNICRKRYKASDLNTHKSVYKNK